MQYGDGTRDTVRNSFLRNEWHAVRNHFPITVVDHKYVGFVLCVTNIAIPVCEFYADIQRIIFYPSLVNNIFTDTLKRNFRDI